MVHVPVIKVGAVLAHAYVSGHGPSRLMVMDTAEFDQRGCALSWTKLSDLDFQDVLSGVEATLSLAGTTSSSE